MKFIGLVPIIIIGLVFFLIQPVNKNISQSVFVVNQGDGIVQIASRLESNKYIRNKYVFILLAYVNQLHQKLKAGTFSLSPSQSTLQIVQQLTQAKTAEYWFKIIEGQRLEELTIKFPKENEGYLFPDSYKIPYDFTPEQILKIINQNFLQKLSQAKLNSSSKLSDQEAVTLASLIEREARTLESKKMISGILQNRLNIGMALQVDATVQYARDTFKKPKSYWQPITSTDLSINSPFNTYTNPGLPPSPICNPGLNSLIAVFNPTPSDYLYYITGNDNQMHYAKTLDQHNLNIAKYLK